MSPIARTFTPRVVCVATGIVLVVPIVAGSPRLPASIDRDLAAPNALHNARIEFANGFERSLRVLGPLVGAEAAQTSQHETIGASVSQNAFGGSIASVSGVSPYVDPSRMFPIPAAGTRAGGAAANPTLDTAAVDGFSQAALRVAAASSNPGQDVQAIAGVLSSLVQSVVKSLGTTPQAIQAALAALGNGDVNGAFISLESLIITPLEFFAIGQGPQTIADALTDLFPQCAPVFQALPSITTSVGIGLIDTYISTRTTIVDAVTNSIKSFGTLNTVVIAQTIGTGISTVTAKLFDAAFGPTGVIATLVNAGQQILNALAPKPTMLSGDSATADAKAAVGPTQHGPAPSTMDGDDTSKVSTSKPGTSVGAGPNGTKDTSSTASSASTSTKDAAGSADSAKTPTDGTDAEGASSDSSATGISGAASDEGHTAGQSSGSTDTHGDWASSTSKPNSTGGATQHEASNAPDHTSTGARSHRPGHNGSGASGETGTSKSAHGASHAAAGGASSTASDKGGDK